MVLSEIMIQVFTNLGLIFVILLIANGITKGFFFKYIKVWASRGKLLMVHIQHPIQDYYVTGIVKGDKIEYKDRTVKKGMIKPLVFNRRAVYRLLGVNMVKIDEEKNVFILPNMEINIE